MCRVSVWAVISAVLPVVLVRMLIGGLQVQSYVTRFDAAGSGTVKWRNVDVRRMLSGACVVNLDVVYSVGTKRRGVRDLRIRYQAPFCRRFCCLAGLHGYEGTCGSMSLGDGTAMPKAHGAICMRGGRFRRIRIRCGTRNGRVDHAD